MKNKFFLILLSIMLLLLFVPVSVFAEEEVTGNAETAVEESTDEISPSDIEYYILGSDGETIPYQQGDVTTSDTEPETSEEISAQNVPLSYQDENGNQAYIEDGAGLYTTVERSKLLTEHNSDASSYARQKYIEIFGETKGTLFLIDMYNRRIQFFSGASMYRTLTRAKTDEITDNIYTYASAGDYYLCTKKAFEQVKIVLEGGHVVAPMRYATNAAFAIGLVLLINFIIITSQRKKSGSEKILTSALVYDGRNAQASVVHNVRTEMTNQKKHKHVESSGGGGGGFHGGGGGGFGGGGGGFSGGGGGHSF